MGKGEADFSANYLKNLKTPTSIPGKIAISSPKDIQNKGGIEMERRVIVHPASRA